MSIISRTQQPNSFQIIASESKLSKYYKLKMPEIKLTRLETVTVKKEKSSETKRSRSKPKVIF